MMKCYFCGSIKEKMTEYEHTSGIRIQLCFMGCQFFAEPYWKANPTSEGNWHRVDPYQKKKVKKND